MRPADDLRFAEVVTDCYNLRTMDEKLAALHRLIDIVESLRAPGGCPWDQQQTLADMGRHMVEEVSEVVDAIEASGGVPSTHVCEELGDLLMNILLAATIASEHRPSGSGAARGQPFGLRAVAEEISRKLVRRHPHVFGDAKVGGVDEVLANWNAIKAKEREGSGSGAGRKDTPPASRLDSVPRSLPPLVRAFELGKEAARAGFDWPDARGAFQKVEEELEEVRALLATGTAPRAGEAARRPARSEALREELGDLLFAAVNLCRKAGVRPDEALRGTLRKFCRRFHAIERRLTDLESQSLEAMEEIWQQEKQRQEKQTSRAEDDGL